VAGRRLALVRRAFRRSVATCVWRVPAAARGKILRGRIDVRAAGAATTLRFARRVS
jgi:hypothetical protein